MTISKYGFRPDGNFMLYPPSMSRPYTDPGTPTRWWYFTARATGAVAGVFSDANPNAAGTFEAGMYERHEDQPGGSV